MRHIRNVLSLSVLVALLATTLLLTSPSSSAGVADKVETVAQSRGEVYSNCYRGSRGYKVCMMGFSVGDWNNQSLMGAANTTNRRVLFSIWDHSNRKIGSHCLPPGYVRYYDRGTSAVSPTAFQYRNIGSIVYC